MKDMSEDERILKVLERLEELRRKGLIDEQYYQEKRSFLLSEYLGLREEESHGSEKGRLRKIILPLIICMIILGVGALIFTSPYMKPVTHTVTEIVSTWATVTETRIVEKPILVTEFYTVTTPTNISQYYNGRSYERIVYSGSLILEKDCQMKGFTIDANKGDVIRVYWEANDYNTYVAVGSDAHLEKNKQYYCEVMISFWKTSWPTADYGYSGSLQFTVPSTGRWYVVVANGHWECVFSECPITVTKLEITHIQS